MKNLFIQKGLLIESTSRKPESFVKLFSFDKWLIQKLNELGLPVFDKCCPKDSEGFTTRLKQDKSGTEYLDADGTWKTVTPTETENFGTATQSGDGTKTSFTIPHGVSGVTTGAYVSVTPKSAAAAPYSYVTVGSVNITVYYDVAPPSGTNNLTWAWNIKKA